MPVKAPYFQGAKLLIAADCTAYAYASFHQDFMRGKITLVGCPKLDSVDYSEKLTEILRENDIQSVTVVRMEVPCCGGLEQAAITALKNSGKFLPWQVVTSPPTVGFWTEPQEKRKGWEREASHPFCVYRAAYCSSSQAKACSRPSSERGTSFCCLSWARSKHRSSVQA